MKTKKMLCGVLSAAIVMMLCSCTLGKNQKPGNGSSEESNSTSAPVTQSTTSGEVSKVPTMELIGHSSVKIKMTDERVIYIDPYYCEQINSYDEPADVILVTHEHGDHNQIHLVNQKDKCTTITEKEAIVDGEYQKIDIDGLTVEAVPAENSNHDINSCVGYVLTFDGVTLYHAGDTSSLRQTSDMLSGRQIDYALYPIDGEYNMDAKEATEFGNSIGAKHNIPMHIDCNTKIYDEQKAKTFTPQGALYVSYGETIELKK